MPRQIKVECKKIDRKIELQNVHQASVVVSANDLHEADFALQHRCRVRTVEVLSFSDDSNGPESP